MASVCWVVDAILQWHGLQIEWVDALEAPDVVAVLVWKRAALMMGVDAAVGAEEVPRHVGVELVELQCLLTLYNRDCGECD